MWSVLVTMGAIAVGAVLHAVESARKLHLSDKEVSSLRQQLDSLKVQHEKTIADLKKMHMAEIDELSNKIPTVLHSEHLEEIREKILVLVSQNERRHDAQIAELAGVTKQLATLHLHELRAEKFVSSSFGLDENSYRVDVWFVEQHGRKYLSHHGLL